MVTDLSSLAIISPAVNLPTLPLLCCSPGKPPTFVQLLEVAVAVLQEKDFANSEKPACERQACPPVGGLL